MYEQIVHELLVYEKMFSDACFCWTKNCSEKSGIFVKNRLQYKAGCFMYSRENQIGFYVRELGNALKKRRESDDSCFGDMNPTMMQRWVLGYLAHHTDHDIYQKELEDNLNIGKSTLSEILHTMEKDGLVERVSSGRCKKIEMTERSLQIDKAIMQQIERTEEKLREGLSEEETADFIRIIKKMIENVKEDCEK